MYSLLLDTHGNSIVIVLYKDGKVFDKCISNTNNKHSVATFPMIKDLFNKNSLDVHDLNEVIVVNGPGSFTGVRIAVTIAKTLAYTLKIPIKSIDSLLILAINVGDDSDKYVAIPDKNGAFIGHFSKENDSMGYLYYSNVEYTSLCSKERVFKESEIEVDYNKVYDFVNDEKYLESNPHFVNPLYVKGLNIGNDK